MISIAENTRQQLFYQITQAFQKAAESNLLPNTSPADFVVEVPADTNKGDFATNAALTNARLMKLPPSQIAQILLEQLDFSSTLIERAEIAGPGFINFFVKPLWFGSILEEISNRGKDYGRSNWGKGKKVMLEFVSANPTGPMHIGNARGGAIGDCLAAALDWAGCDVTREFYINDAGNQIERFGISLEVRYLQIFQGAEAVPLPEDCYQGLDIVDHAQSFADLYGDKYLETDSRTRRDALVAYALPKNIQKLKDDLLKYRVQYDVWFKESSLYPDAVQDILDHLTEAGLTYQQEGALWYKATQFGGEKDEVLVRSGGIPTYFAADIAYHYNKFAVRGFDTVINIWGADHHGHVIRIKGAMDALGLHGDKLDVVLMQLVRLMKDGQPQVMSKRSGRAITLADLTDEIPIDAARFFFIMREPGSPLDFDLTLAAKESTENPVFYVQYAHARICSILKNLEAEGIRPRPLGIEDYGVLSQWEERELIRRLGQLPGEIVASARDYDPAKLTSYITDVATLFHKFYNTCRCKGVEESLQQARLNLCMATRTVLCNVLGLLKISAPEVM